MTSDASPPRLKYHLSQMYSGGTPDTGNDEYWSVDDSGIAWVAIGDMSSVEVVTATEKRITEEGRLSKRLEIVPKGTIIYSMYASLGHVAELALPATINQALIGFKFRKEVNQDYVKWFLRHYQPRMVEEASSSTQNNLNAEKIRNLYIPLPDTSTQSRVANYLDRETTHIDDLIAEKEHMLVLLEEKRAALISQAVTRGLNPDVSLKPIGLDWLGDIPAHWDIERAKNVFSVRDERSETGEEELLTVSHITGVTSRSEKEVNMFKADDMTGYKRCYPEDLVINTLWAWMGAMGVTPLAGIISPDYHVYESKGLLLPEYVELLCRSNPFVSEVNRWSKGVWSSRLRLYPENFFEMRLPIPPKDEQREIVRAVEDEGKTSRELATALNESISLIKERRSALITAAVTGQIDSKDMAT